MTEDRVLQLIGESFKQLKEDGMLEGNISLSSETSLLGAESPLDSIGFVTFITDLEERVVEETKKDLYLVLNEIKGFNVDNPQLSIDILTQHIVNISKGAQNER